MEAAYLGDIAVDSMYLGDNLVYSSGPFQGLKVRPISTSVEYTGGTFELTVKSSEDWTLSMDSTYLSASTYTGTTGESTVTITAEANTGDTNIVTRITALTTNYSAETEVTIKNNSSLDGINFLFNYNAKNYNSSTRTIPNHSGGTLSQGMVFQKSTNLYYASVGSAITVSSDHISFSGGTYAQFAYSNASQSPFNITDAQPNLTVVVKWWRNPNVSNWKNNPQSDLLANRGDNPNSINWILRCDASNIYAITTGNSETLPWSAIPVTIVYRFTNKQLQIKNISEGTSTSVMSPSYNQGTNRLTLFGQGYQLSASDVTNGVGGDFYWIFLSRDSLTDEQIQQVINYNDSV